MSATNIISLDRHRGPGTYAEALLVQSHQKEAAPRSAKILNYGCSTDENVICSKTTQGVLESLINPNTMDSDSSLAQPSRWSAASREGRVMRRTDIQHTVRYTELSPTRFRDFWRGQRLAYPSRRWPPNTLMDKIVAQDAIRLPAPSAFLRQPNRCHSAATR